MKQKSSRITDVFALVVFGVFALCVLLVLLTGAGVYRRLVESGSKSYQDRTAVQYVATRVRQAETVAVEDFWGCQALTLREELDGEGYITRIYCYDGYLRELFCEEAASLLPEDGEQVLEAEAFQASLDGELLTVQVDSREVTLYLRSGREVGP